MTKIESLGIKELFARAILNHQNNKLKVAEDLYHQILEIDPNHEYSCNNLGVLFQTLKEYQKAKNFFEKGYQKYRFWKYWSN